MLAFGLWNCHLSPFASDSPFFPRSQIPAPRGGGVLSGFLPQALVQGTPAPGPLAALMIFSFLASVDASNFCESPFWATRSLRSLSFSPLKKPSSCRPDGSPLEHPSASLFRISLIAFLTSSHSSSSSRRSISQAAPSQSNSPDWLLDFDCFLPRLRRWYS